MAPILSFDKAFVCDERGVAVDLTENGMKYFVACIEHMIGDHDFSHIDIEGLINQYFNHLYDAGTNEHLTVEDFFYGLYAYIEDCIMSIFKRNQVLMQRNSNLRRNILEFYNGIMF